MKYDAIVLARSGSKGIPRKNLIDFAGKPLIAWTIESAKSSNCVRDVIVSTDTDEIAVIAEHYGAIVPQLRPRDISGDGASSESALVHALEHLCNQPLTDAFLFPQVTSPIRRDGLFDDAFAAFLTGGFDTLFSSTRIRNFLWKGSVCPVPLYDPRHRPMRQELRPEEIYYRENGNFYICRTDCFLHTRCRLFGKIGMFETDDEEAMEVDDPADLDRLRLLMSMRERMIGDKK